MPRGARRGAGAYLFPLFYSLFPLLRACCSHFYKKVGTFFASRRQARSGCTHCSHCSHYFLHIPIAMIFLFFYFARCIFFIGRPPLKQQMLYCPATSVALSLLREDGRAISARRDNGTRARSMAREGGQMTTRRGRSPPTRARRCTLRLSGDLRASGNVATLRRAIKPQANRRG